MRLRERRAAESSEQRAVQLARIRERPERREAMQQEGREAHMQRRHSATSDLQQPGVRSMINSKLAA